MNLATGVAYMDGRTDGLARVGRRWRARTDDVRRLAPDAGEGRGGVVYGGRHGRGGVAYGGRHARLWLV